MIDNYVMCINLNDGRNYSCPITDDEWNEFIKLADKLDGLKVPAETLKELWWPEQVNAVDSVMIRRV